MNKALVIRALNLLKADVQKMDSEELEEFIDWWDTRFEKVKEGKYCISYLKELD